MIATREITEVIDFNQYDKLFTPRELEVLNFLCQGLTTREIAQKIYLSTHTIESHKKNMIQKLGCRNLVQLIVYAVKNDLVH